MYTTFIRIQHPNGLFSKGGRRPSFTKKGKVYTPSTLNRHFALIAGKPTDPNFHYQRLLDAYKDCTIYVQEFYYDEHLVPIKPSDVTLELCHFHPQIDLVKEQKFEVPPSLSVHTIVAFSLQKSYKNLLFAFISKGLVRQRMRGGREND